MRKTRDWWLVIIAFSILIVDQITKKYIIEIKDTGTITVVKGILNFTYCQNTGGAFSVGNDHTSFIIVLTTVMLIALMVWFIKNRQKYTKMFKIFFTMVIGCGVSNLIDRIFRGYVVDFIDINQIFRFPIFNIADIGIVLGIIGILIEIIRKDIPKAQ